MDWLSYFGYGEDKIKQNKNNVSKNIKKGIRIYVSVFTRFKRTNDLSGNDKFIIFITYFLCGVFTFYIFAKSGGF